MDAFVDSDLVVMATDNLQAEIATAQRCLYLRKPLLQASVHGETLVVQIRWFGDVAKGRGACPACSYSQAELSHAIAGTKFSCEGYRGARPEFEIETAPTVCVSAVCNLAADMAMTQVLRFALGLGQPTDDFCLEYCGFTHRTVLGRLRPRVSQEYVDGPDEPPLPPRRPEALGISYDERHVQQGVV